MHLQPIKLHKFTSRVRSRHLYPVISTFEQDIFALDDEQALASVYFIDARDFPKSPATGQEDPDTSSVNEEKLHRLAKNYKFEDNAGEYLTQHPFLFTPLFQAIDAIRKAFGIATDLRLDILKESGTQQLFVLISTSLDSERALKKLADFDKNWWFNVPHEIHDYLEFTLEFV